MRIFTVLLLALILSACDNKSGEDPIVNLPDPDTVETDGLHDISGQWYGRINPVNTATTPVVGNCLIYPDAYFQTTLSNVDGVVTEANFIGDLFIIKEGACEVHSYTAGLFGVPIPVTVRQSASTMSSFLNAGNVLTISTFTDESIVFSNVYNGLHTFNVILSRLPI